MNDPRCSSKVGWRFVGRHHRDQERAALRDEEAGLLVVPGSQRIAAAVRLQPKRIDG